MLKLYQICWFLLLHTILSWFQQNNEQMSHERLGSPLCWPLQREEKRPQLSSSSHDSGPSHSKRRHRASPHRYHIFVLFSKSFLLSLKSLLALLKVHIHFLGPHAASSETENAMELHHHLLVLLQKQGPLMLSIWKTIITLLAATIVEMNMVSVNLRIWLKQNGKR